MTTPGPIPLARLVAVSAARGEHFDPARIGEPLTRTVAQAMARMSAQLEASTRGLAASVLASPALQRASPPPPPARPAHGPSVVLPGNLHVIH